MDAGSATVDVRIEGATDLGAFEVWVEFDPSVLSFAYAQPGEFLGSTGRYFQCVGPRLFRSGSIVNYGCNTKGLAGNSQPGPDGDGLLVTLYFTLAGHGESPLTFARRDTSDPEDVILGTELSPVEDGGGSLDYPFTTSEGVVLVYDAVGGTPTALPATPTKVPRSATPDLQATSAAVFGTPVVLGNTSPGGSGSGGEGGSGAGGSRPGGNIGPPSGGQGGADGAPIAGYGPQREERSVWPVVLGAVLAMTGAACVAAGARARRLGQRNSLR